MIIKGIVHPKRTIWCLSAFLQGIQDVGDFVSSVEHKWRFLTQTFAVCQSYHGSQWDPRLWESKKHRQNQIKPCGSWRYIEVLRHETISLCKKLNSIYNIYNFYLWYTAMSNCPERVYNSRPLTRQRIAYMCSGMIDACVEAI